MDDLDVGGILEGRFMHIAPLRDTYFGEAGATPESSLSNLLYPLRKFHARELFAILERFIFYLRLPFGYDGFAVLNVVAVLFVFCHSSSFGWFIHGKDTNKRVK